MRMDLLSAGSGSMLNAVFRSWTCSACSCRYQAPLRIARREISSRPAKQRLSRDVARGPQRGPGRGSSYGNSTANMRTLDRRDEQQRNGSRLGRYTNSSGYNGNSMRSTSTEYTQSSRRSDGIDTGSVYGSNEARPARNGYKDSSSKFSESDATAHKFRNYNDTARKPAHDFNGPTRTLRRSSDRHQDSSASDGKLRSEHGKTRLQSTQEEVDKTRKSASQSRSVLERPPKLINNRLSKTGNSVLSAVPLHERTADKGAIKGIDTFESTRISSLVLDAIKAGPLRDLEYAAPTNIQARAIPAILASGKKSDISSFLIAAETGSGKTLAYLAPIMQLMKAEEEHGKVERQIGRPRCIVLVPSAELVKQVGQVVKAMSHSVKLSSTILLPDYDFRRTKNQVLMSPVDILVTMPHRLDSLIQEKIVSLQETRHMVIDEADTMLDVSFADLVRPLIDGAETLKTLIFCSATIPRSIDAFLQNHYKSLERLVSPKIHSIPRRIAVKFIDVKADFKGDKNVATHQILRDLSLDQSEPGKVKKVILFVNKRESVASVAAYISAKGIEALPYSRDAPDREINISHFIGSNATTRNDEEDGQSAMKVLVTTDLASRGIDTTGVKNVIIYDTPNSTIDFLHRVGRTGRAGRRGTAYVLDSGKQGEKWLRDTKHLSITGQPLV